MVNPWVSPIIVVPKKTGEVRICVDMREANKAVKREKHLMPTTDDLVADLNGATVFSKLDLSSGYHQFELTPESRHITTFSTHIGLRRYKRLLFGINAAAEIFQNAIEEILAGLPVCKNISDDIIVYGKDQREHDKNLHGVLETQTVRHPAQRREVQFLAVRDNVLWPYLHCQGNQARPQESRQHYSHETPTEYK